MKRVCETVVYPSKPMDQGHYDCRMRFMCMKHIAMANLCPTRVPIAYKVISDYHGIILPGRDVGGTDAPGGGGGGTIGRYRTWGRQAPGGGASHHQSVPHLGAAPAPGGGALTCAASVLARDRRGIADSGALLGLAPSV